MWPRPGQAPPEIVHRRDRIAELAQNESLPPAAHSFYQLANQSLTTEIDRYLRTHDEE